MPSIDELWGDEPTPAKAVTPKKSIDELWGEESQKPKPAGFFKSTKAAIAETIPFVGKNLSETILEGQKSFFEPQKAETSRFIPDVDVTKESIPQRIKREYSEFLPDIAPLKEAVKESPKRIAKAIVQTPFEALKAAAVMETPLGQMGPAGTASAFSLVGGSSEAFQRDRKPGETGKDVVKEYAKDIGVNFLQNLPFLAPGIIKGEPLFRYEKPPVSVPKMAKPQTTEEFIIDPQGNVVPSQSHADLLPPEAKKEVSKNPKLNSTFNQMMTSIYSERRPLDVVEKIFGANPERLPSDSFKAMQGVDAESAFKASKLTDDHLVNSYYKDKEGYNLYSIARRTIEKQGQINEYRSANKMQESPNIVSGMTVEEAQAIVKKTETKSFKESFENQTKMVQEEYKTFLDHVVGKENAQKIIEKNKDYVTFKVDPKKVLQRVAPPESQIARPGLPQSVHPLKGEVGRTPQDFEDPTMSTMKTFFKIRKANAYYKMLSEFHEEVGMKQDPEMQKLFRRESNLPTFEIGFPQRGVHQMLYEPVLSGEETLDPDTILSMVRPNNLPKDVLMVPYKGKQIYYRFTPEGKPLLDVLAHEPQNVEGWKKIVRAYGKFSRAMMTELNPSFLTPGAVAHSTIRAVQSPEAYPYQYLLNYPKAIVDVVGGTESYENFLKSGAGYTSISSQDIDRFQNVTRRIPLKAKFWIDNPGEAFRRVLWWGRHPIESMRVISEKVSQIPAQNDFNVRYKNLISEGKSPELALRKAGVGTKDAGPNYSDIGKTLGRDLKDVDPFFNAWVRSFDPIAKTAPKDLPKLFFGITKYITAPAVSLWAYRHHNSEVKKQYDKLSDDEKMFYLHVPKSMIGMGVGPGEDAFIRVKRPWGLGYVGGRAVEDYLDWSVNKDPDAMKRIVTDSKVAMPHLAGPILNAITISMIERGHDFFTGRDVLSEKDMRKLPSDRFGPRTSETGKAVGEITRNLPKPLQVSPKKVDALVRSQFGGTGSLTLKLLDKLGEGVAKVVDMGPYFAKIKAYEDTGYDTGLNRGSMEKFMNRYNTAQQAYTTVRDYKKTGNPRFKELREKYKNEIKTWKLIRPVLPRLTDMMKVQDRMISQNPNDPRIAEQGDKINRMLEKVQDKLDGME